MVKDRRLFGKVLLYFHIISLQSPKGPSNQTPSISFSFDNLLIKDGISPNSIQYSFPSLWFCIFDFSQVGLIRQVII